MNARIREKKAAYLAAMGREPEASPDPRGANVVAIRPAGVAESDEVVVTFDKPRRTWRVRGKTTRVIVAAICRELGRAPAQVIATPTRQGDVFSAWIKANDGPEAESSKGPDGGERLAFVVGITPTILNIVLGHPIPRVEMIKGRAYPMGSSQAAHARAEAAGMPDEAHAIAAATEAAEAAATFEPEHDPSGDDDR